MDEKLKKLVGVILDVEREYAYENRNIKTQRQTDVFKKVDNFLKDYLEDENAPEQD